MSHSPPHVDWLIQFSVGCEWVYSLFGLSTWRTVFRLENSLFLPEKWSKLRKIIEFTVLRIVTYQIYACYAGVRFILLQVKSAIEGTIFFYYLPNTFWKSAFFLWFLTRNLPSRRPFIHRRINRWHPLYWKFWNTDFGEFCFCQSKFPIFAPFYVTTTLYYLVWSLTTY